MDGSQGPWPENLPEILAGDWRRAGLPSRLRALLEYAERLTRRPGEVDEADVVALREEGWSDEAILHAAEVTAYYNFVNRTTEGLGVRLEPDWPHDPIEPYDAGEYS